MTAGARTAVFVVGTCASCAAPEAAPVELLAPSLAEFSAVSSVLERRCGTLDCHGSPARNLRVYGRYGLRASARDVTGGRDTTAAEVAATHESVVAIDPEALSRVTADGARSSERWIVVSKGRGLEEHVGGARWAAGWPADVCVLSWIAGSTDVAACAADTFDPVPRDGEEW